MPLFTGKNKTPLGIYIHVPFCAQKCRYCDFYSFPKGEEFFEIYKTALSKPLSFTEKSMQGLITLCISVAELPFFSVKNIFAV